MPVDDEIINLKTEILVKLQEAENTKNKFERAQRIAVVKTKILPQLLEKRIKRDLPNISSEKQKELLLDIQQFISLGKEKKYFSDINIVDVLKQLTLGLNKVEEMPAGAIYGRWGGCRGSGSMMIDLTLSSNLMRHIVFHELAHCITPDVGPVSPNTDKVYRPSNLRGKEGKLSYVGKPGYEFGWNESEIVFLRECMAESMACELDGMYKLRTLVSTNGADITSDWNVTYNRTYQQLGDEFLQTLPFINTKENDTDRKRFKALTIMAIDSNNIIAKKIDEAYNRKNSKTGSKDLESITIKLSKLLHRTSVTQKEVDDLRKEMQPYQQEPQITIIRRGDTKSSKTEKSIEDKKREMLELFSILSPEDKVELTTRLYNIHEEGKKVLNQFVQLPKDSQKEMYERMQGIIKEREKE